MDKIIHKFLKYGLKKFEPNFRCMKLFSKNIKMTLKIPYMHASCSDKNINIRVSLSNF